METAKEFYDRYFGYVSSNISDLFRGMGTLKPADLSEFVYGIDQLDEITKTAFFKSNRVLETPDTLQCRREVNRLFNSCRLYKGDTNWKIKTVGFDTQAAITSFFQDDYLTKFFMVMLALKENDLKFTLDGNPYTIKLEPRTPHEAFGLFIYVDHTTKKVLRLPFFLNRLAKGLRLNKGMENVLVRCG